METKLFGLECPVVGYHVTTQKKLARYIETGSILPPVRFWSVEEAARRWMKHTSRDVLLRIEVPGVCYPLSDHTPGWWTRDCVRDWIILEGA